MLQLKHTAKAN